MNGIAVTVSIHRLVAIAFIPNPENKQTVNHIFGNNIGKAINTVWNLEWATQREQMIHAFQTGLNSNKGIHNSRCIIDESTAFNIGKMLKNGETVPSISDKLNIPTSLVYNILYGKSWPHVKETLKLNNSDVNKHKSYATRKLSKDDIFTILSLKDEGLSNKKIAEKIDNKISHKSIYAICNRPNSYRAEKEEYKKLKLNKNDSSTTIENEFNGLIIEINIDDKDRW